MARRRRARRVARSGVRSRRRRTRRNPAGGFLPLFGGFLAVPIATHLLAGASTAVVAASNGAQGVNNRAQIFDVGAAVLAWAGKDRIKDPGYHAFVTGGMWGSIAAAVLRPVVLALLAARGELPQGPLPVVYTPNAPALPPPAPRRPELAEADDEYEPSGGYSNGGYQPEATPMPGVVEDDSYGVDDLAFDVIDVIPGVGLF